MPFTAPELENITNAALDYHWNTPNVRAQTLQDKPFLRAMESATGTFPGGKEFITGRVKGVYSTVLQGFQADDTVGYGNPANTKTWTVPWKLTHAGINFTMHELLKAGISINDTNTGEKTSAPSQPEKIMLANLLKEKIEDMQEGADRGRNVMYWLDGTQDASLVPGVASFVVDNPALDVTVAGLNQVTHTWWRNRASLAINLGASAATGAVLNTLQYEFRQLRRYGKGPNLALAGSDMMTRIEQELKAQGYYTQTGWAGKGRIDGSVSDLAFKGLNIDYDPTLDDLGYAKRLYLLDTSAIRPMVIDGENGKDHAPSRPEDKYVFYRARTWVGGLTCAQRNTSGVYAFP